MFKDILTSFQEPLWWHFEWILTLDSCISVLHHSSEWHYERIHISELNLKLIVNENKWLYTNVGCAYIISCLRQDGLGGMISTFSMFFTKTMFAPLSAQKHLPFEDLSCPGREMSDISLESINCKHDHKHMYILKIYSMLLICDLSELKLTFHPYSDQADEKNKSCNSLHCLLVLVQLCLCYV